jgi:hypothetical protein
MVAARNPETERGGARPGADERADEDSTSESTGLPPASGWRRLCESRGKGSPQNRKCTLCSHAGLGAKTMSVNRPTWTRLVRLAEGCGAILGFSELPLVRRADCSPEGGGGGTLEEANHWHWQSRGAGASGRACAVQRGWPADSRDVLSCVGAEVLGCTRPITKDPQDPASCSPSLGGAEAGLRVPGPPQ